MALLNTDKLSAHDQTFRQDRYMHESWLQEGVVGATDYKVTPGGASLQWSVAAGAAWVRGDDTTRQGLYSQVNDAAVTGLVASGHATLPRIDQVVLRVFDSSVTGVSDTPTLATLAGTATAGATLDNRNGAAALPNSAIRLADILVPALQSGVISAANIRDRRPWARGYNYSAQGSGGGNYTTTSTSLVTLASGGYDGRFEKGSGSMFVVEMDLHSLNVGASICAVAININGTLAKQVTLQATAGFTVPGHLIYRSGVASNLVNPTDGSSNVWTVTFATSNGANAATVVNSAVVLSPVLRAYEVVLLGGGNN